MSKQNKWADGMGKVASGGPSTFGTNVYKDSQKYDTAGAPKAAMKPTVVKSKISLSGRNNAVTEEHSSMTSHNSINTFTRGIKSRGPYGGPSFGSFNSSKMNMQKSDTSSISKFTVPSKQGAKPSGANKSKLK